MQWLPDGWCIIGQDLDGDGIGEPVTKFRRPAGPQEKLEGLSALATGTGFTGASIPLNWQWEANPQFNWFMTNPTLGCLRLHCIKKEDGWRNLRDTPNILAQKVVGPAMQFTTKLVYRPAYAGERVGVIVTGRSYATLELDYDGEALTLVRKDCPDAQDGRPETVLASLPLEKADYNTVWIRVDVKDQVICTFSYSLDGRRFKPFGPPFTGRDGHWVGAKVGYFAVSDIQKNDGGTVEVY